MKKSSTNKKIRLTLRGQIIRGLRDLADQELERANGARICGDEFTSIAVENNCTMPH